MTDGKRKRITELEKELAPLLKGTNGFDERYRAVKHAVSGFFSGSLKNELGSEDFKVINEYSDSFIELSRLYDELVYQPDEDEKTLDYLFRDGMSNDEKLKALADAWWYATNSGYSDAMANRLMAGEEDAQTRLWEKNCGNKSAIDRYYKYLREVAENA